MAPPSIALPPLDPEGLSLELQVYSVARSRKYRSLHLNVVISVLLMDEFRALIASEPSVFLSFYASLSPLESVARELAFKQTAFYNTCSSDPPEGD